MEAVATWVLAGSVALVAVSLLGLASGLLVALRSPLQAWRLALRTPAKAYGVSFESEQLLQRLVEEESESHTSANELVLEGLDLALRRRAGLRAVAEWEAEHGELTEAELEQARLVLLGKSGRRETA